MFDDIIRENLSPEPSKRKKIKVYFYGANGDEIFSEIYDVDSIDQMLYVVNETAFNNNGVYTYYINPIEQEE